MKLKYLIFSVFLFFTGCSNNNLTLEFTKKKRGICYTQPSWVLNIPNENDFIYGVGIAPQNFYGQQAQRKSAISKAINEIATQLNTKVNSQLVRQTSINNGQTSSSMSSVSFQTVDGEQVSAKIIKSCKNPDNGYLYILMKAHK